MIIGIEIYYGSPLEVTRSDYRPDSFHRWAVFSRTLLRLLQNPAHVRLDDELEVSGLALGIPFRSSKR